MSITLAEVLHEPEDLLRMEDGHRYELIDGRLVERNMGAKGSLIAATIICTLNRFVRPQMRGLVFATDCGYQIFPGHPKRVRFPDVSYIARGRLPNDEPPDGHVRIAPDLAAEVVSPNDLAEKLEEKIHDYLQAGIKLVWVIYPSTRCVMVYRPGGACSRLTASDSLEGEDVLPGFTCRVEELFAGIA
jgi:Uma2 family endonuclease